MEARNTTGALAAAAREIELIVAARAGLCRPGWMAQMGANIDRISNGRFAINIVSGWWEHELRMLGLPVVEHDDRHELSIEVMRGAYSGAKGISGKARPARAWRW